MPAGEIFTVGTGGVSTHLDIAKWYGIHAARDKMQKVCMPFVGMGRIMSGVCRDDTIIDVCDFQRISTGIIEGVFNAEEWKSNVGPNLPRLRKGKAFELGDKFVEGVSRDCAGFIDWIAEHGTLLDIMSIGMAIPGQTERGRMGLWVGNFGDLYDRFRQIREQAREFIPRPGWWFYWEDDFFKLMEDKTWPYRAIYDLLVLDLPYLSGNTDMYSTGSWQRLNSILGGDVTIEPWTYKNYYQKLLKALEVKSKYLMITWTDIKSSRIIPQDLRTWFIDQTHGTLEDEQRWSANPKTLFGWKIKRGDL